jgi:hypothetical protein
MCGKDSCVREEVYENLRKRGIPFAEEIACYCAQVVEEVNPLLIILSGSMAIKAYMPWSDVDVIVIADFKEKFIDRIALLLNLNETRAPIEPVGYTEKEVKRMLLKLVPGVVDAVRDGIPLLDRGLFRDLKRILKRMDEKGLRKTSCTYTFVKP